MEINKQILSKLGIETLNPMQDAAYWAILQEKTTFLISTTGSGKTLAFLLPLLQILDPKKNTVQCLILTPSRELAMQIENVWKSMCSASDFFARARCIVPLHIPFLRYGLLQFCLHHPAICPSTSVIVRSARSARSRSCVTSTTVAPDVC